MFERVITQTIQTISQQILRERPLIALSEILEEERIPYRFKPFFETEVAWWLHNESLARATNKRFDYQNPEVASLVAYLEQVQFRHAHFEREEFMAVLDSAVKLSYNYLCRPQITLKWYLFRGQPVKPLREVMLRFGAFVDYSYFFHVFSEWVERKCQERPTFDAISASEFERIIRRVDDQILLSCTVEDLLGMMDPLFEFIGEGDDLIIPIDALIIFFDDKNINKLVEHLERIRERGMATVGREEFVGLLDELLTSADENPEADFSNVYQNDELDDVVRMHLQSGPSRAAESDSEASDPPAAAEHPVRPNVSPETFAPIPPTIASHLRTSRAPIDPALLDALDDDDPLPGSTVRSEPVRSEPVSSEPVHSEPVHSEPAQQEPLQQHLRADLEESPTAGADPVLRSIDEESDMTTLPHGFYNREPDREQPSERAPQPAPSDSPASDTTPDQAETPLPWITGRSEEVNEEVEEWVEGLAEALGEWEENPSETAMPLNGNGSFHASRDLQDVLSEDDTGMGEDSDDAQPDNLGDLLGDDLVESTGAADVAPDDIFELADDIDTDESDDPLDVPQIFQIDDLEEEFEPEGPDDEDVSDVTDVTEAVPTGESDSAGFPENPIAGTLSGHENLFQRQAQRPEPEQTPSASGRNGAASPPASGDRTTGSSTPALEDVRRYIDAMLERKLVKKIFQRDRTAYDVALEQLNGADSWRMASQILDEIFIRYEIDPYSRTALRFTDSVYARYLPAKQ